MKKSRLIAASLFASLLFASCGGGIKDGKYEASAKGNNGDVTVSVTLENAKIKDVSVVNHSETPGISDKAISELPSAIVKYQTTNLDAVSGATNSSKAILSAARAALSKAGAKASDFDVKAEKAKAADITKTADIIIVGGGGAGLAAAITATDLGSSVIVLEKTGAVGGNTMVCGGIYNAPDPEMQEPRGIKDSVEFYTKQTWEAGDKLGDINLVKVLCSNALDGLHWLRSVGVEFKDTIIMGVGSLYERTHTCVKPLGTGFIEAYSANLAKKSNAEIMTLTTAKDLIVENGVVKGVIAEGETGNKITLKANKAVILTTGGFAGNVDLRVKYCEGDKWPYLGPNVQTTNTPGVTGDGIFMAERINAALVDMDQIQLLHMGNPKSGKISGICEPIGTAGTIFINKEGKRFVREDGRRDEMCKAILNQTDALMYVIESGEAIPDIASAKTLDGSPLQQWIDSGDQFAADTIEELAQKINVPADALKQTIETYNASIDAGKDLDGLGRQLLKTKFTKGPWTANPRVPSAHHTMGGIKIDTECHVIDKNGNIIPGLFAAGEVTGGIHGTNRVGGNAVVDTVVFGRIAGKGAAGL